MGNRIAKIVTQEQLEVEGRNAGKSWGTRLGESVDRDVIAFIP
jgi:hypothetical protein